MLILKGSRFFNNTLLSEIIMKVRHFIIVLLFFFLATQSNAIGPSVVPLSPELKSFAYAPGERLVYDVSYFGIPAGRAEMSVSEMTEMDGRAVYHIVSTVESNKFVTIFYPVKDRVETYIDAERGYSHAIRIKQRQGRKKRDKIITFNQIHHRAIQVKDNQVKMFIIPPMVQDSLSSLYHFRNQKVLEVGQSTFIDVHESDKNWELEIQVLGKEIITTSLGKFNTIKAKALVRYEGLFMDKGDVTFWFTDDEKHIPVLIKTKIRIGSITASLVSLEQAELGSVASFQAKASTSTEIK